MPSLFLYLFFFLSGFSALVYELIWTRKLALIFGNTPYAVSTVLAIFFGGLAIGSWLAGKIIKNLKPQAPNHKQKSVWNLEFGIYNLYALIELGIGLLALTTLPLIPLLNHLPLPPTLSPVAILSIIIASLPILLPPTVLIGATLPVMVALVRSVTQEQNELLGKTTAKVYAANTFGAVLGVFLTAFFLIAFLGVNETLLSASGINLLIGCTILLIKRRQKDNLYFSRPTPSGSHFETPGRWPNGLLPDERSKQLLLVAFFLSGSASLALEVLLTRSLILSFGSSTYSFATILTTFLFGIALGSALAVRWLRYKKQRRDPLTLFSLCLVAIALITLAVIPIIGNLPLIFLNWVTQDSSFLSIQTLIFLLSFILLLPATIFMGATFPFVVEACQQCLSLQPRKHQPCEAKEAVATVGSLYAINTLGGIVGSLLAGFVFISLLGVKKSIIFTAIIYLTTGVALLWYQANTTGKRIKIAVVTTVILLIAFFIPSWNKKIVTLGSFIYFPQLKSESPAELRSQMAARELLFYKDGLVANVAVYQGENGDRFLRLNGKTDASTIGDLESELLIGHLPMLLAKQTKDVLVIGFGAGISLGAVTTYPAEHIDMVEIEPLVIEAAPFFKDANHNALADPRVNLVSNDGRNFLTRSNKSYDVITSEPSNPWISGIANLYTREFFEEAKQHLKEEGVMLQWLHLYSLSPSDLRTILRTFSSVFPNVSGWTPLSNNDLLLIGSKTEHATTLTQLDELVRQPEVNEDLERIGTTRSYSLMRHYLLDDQAIREIAQDGWLHTDNHPILEFSAPKSLWSTATVQNLKLLFKYRAKDVSYILPENPESEELVRELLLRDSVLSSSIILEDSLDRSINLAEEAFGLNPEIPQLREFLADLYFDKAKELFSQERVSDAGLYLTKTITAAPNHALAHANLGAVYLTNGLLDQAKAELEEAIRLSPNRTEPHINLSLYYQKIGEVSQAKEELKKTLTLDPENSQAKELLKSLQ